MIYFKWETRKKSWKPISVNCLCCCHYSLLLFLLEWVTRDSAEIRSWLSWNGSIALMLCLQYPAVEGSDTVSAPHTFFPGHTQYAVTQLWSHGWECKAMALLSPGMVTHWLCLFSFFPQFPPCVQKTRTPVMNDSVRKNQGDFELILAQLPQEEWPQKS